jgi:glycosyltransferase involved in cell wall biosynthesis
MNEKYNLPKLRFVITGSGRDAGIIRRLAKHYSNVIYLGYLSMKDLVDVYRRSSLAILTSRGEGMPLRLLEAQSTGLPVVAFDVPGVNDVVVSGVSGLLSPYGDIDGIVSAIVKYYKLWEETPSDYDNLCANIRRFICSKYDLHITIDKFELMLRDVTQTS